MASDDSELLTDDETAFVRRFATLVNGFNELLQAWTAGRMATRGRSMLLAQLFLKSLIPEPEGWEQCMQTLTHHAACLKCQGGKPCDDCP